MSFQAVPDLGSLAYGVRLCRLTLQEIGKNLPCIEKTMAEFGTYDPLTMSKSEESKPFDDSGVMPIGETCPVAADRSLPSDNTFIANAVYELPPQTETPSGEVKFHAGIKDAAQTIWVASSRYTAQSSAYTSAIATGDVKGLIKPFISDYPIVVTKDRAKSEFAHNEGFSIKYILKTNPQTYGKYVFKVNFGSDKANFKLCRLRLTQIGANYPCTMEHPKSVDGDETSILAYSPTAYDAGSQGEYTFTVSSSCIWNM